MTFFDDMLVEKLSPGSGCEPMPRAWRKTRRIWWPAERGGDLLVVEVSPSAVDVLVFDADE